MRQDLHSSNAGERRRPEVRGDAGLHELRREVRELRRGNARSATSRRRRRSAGRRRRFVALVGIAAVALVVLLNGGAGRSRSFPPPTAARLAGLSQGQRIVAIASSQIGYRTDPAGSYCNKFSAYWGSGNPTCPAGEASEQWCADFAAWAWQRGGVGFSYGYAPGDLNAGAISFYRWGVDHGTWHPDGSGYRGRPGDVAVYGLDLSGYQTAAHVAIVIDDPAGQRGPNVVNGDGDRTGFSVAELGTDQLMADAGHHEHAALAGYVSPT